MLNWIKSHPFITIFVGIPMAELAARFPSINEFTDILKLLVQLLLLATAIYEIYHLWKARN